MRRKFSIGNKVIVKNRSRDCGPLGPTIGIVKDFVWNAKKNRIVYTVEIIDKFNEDNDCEYEYCSNELDHVNKDNLSPKENLFDLVRDKMNEIRDYLEDIEEKLSVIDDFLNEIESGKDRGETT